MSGTYNIDIASVKEACPVCAKSIDGPILLGKKLHKGNNKLEHLNGQVIGFAKEPCEECQKLSKTGFILIGVIPTENEDPQNPFRSGHMWVVTHEYIERVFKEDFVKGKAWAFIHTNVAEQIGLPLKIS